MIAGIDCQCIHGDREQSDREQALLDLKTGEVRILIATDVASRGIDIHDITHVINFDFPGKESFRTSRNILSVRVASRNRTRHQKLGFPGLGVGLETRKSAIPSLGAANEILSW